jgi:3-oxoacyl-[acyl-carrier-protein] synthase-3
MKAYINYISYYLPEDKLTNEKINKLFPEWSVDKISSKTGIYSRHISGNDELTSDLAFKAATKVIEENDIDKSKIDYLLLCTQSPDYFLPTTACILQDMLKLKKNCGALDFNLGCSGYIYGLGLAKGLIASKQATNVLLITSESYSKFIHESDKSNRTIFGDAAAATIISSTAIGITGEIMDFVYGTDGSGANSLIVKNGALKNKKTNDLGAIDEYGNIVSDNHLYMNGRDVFNFTLNEVPPLIEDVLTKNKLEKDDINLFVFHQANKFMLNHLMKKIEIPEDKFFLFLENCGNTVSSTIPIALAEANKKVKLNINNNILLAGFGVGLSWGGVIITIKR